jgi:hypothetical protein
MFSSISLKPLFFLSKFYMNQFITRLTTLLLLLFPALVMGQAKTDYQILLHSGKFTPAANMGSLTKESKVLAEARFLDQQYVVIQFTSLPSEQLKTELKANGITLLDYLPNNAFTAAVKTSFNLAALKNAQVRSVFRLQASHKTMPALINGNFPAHAVKSAGAVDVTITTYSRISSNEVADAFAALGIKILEEVAIFRNFTVRIPQQQFRSLLNLPFVQWVEAIDPPNRKENLLGRSLHRVNTLNDGVRNLKGQGINVGIWDGGEVDKHLDFSPVNTRITLAETSALTDHGTHCSGTIGGGGLINPKARGMAPLCRIFSWDFNGNIPAEQAAAIPARGLSVSSHSYGSGTPTCGVSSSAVAYSTTSRNTDLNLNNFPNHLHIHSAGNSQTECSGGWSTITSSGKSAKNNILVADITTTEGLSGSSSCGPVADGRVKPEISALGTNVLSTVLSNGYATFSGTSMATPGVAGSAALLVERYRQLNANADPSSALIKNTILNTANDLGNLGPDYRFGYGRLNALSAVRVLEQNRYAVNTITTGATNDLSINVPAGAIRLKVMITWNDPAATANANPALVNNLNLSVINGSTTSLPWILDPLNPSTPATTGIDNVSNIEQVVILNPAAGAYTLRVDGAAIPVGPQQYSITWSVDQPYIEMIFPNGAESFSPGTAETITWDNAGLTGTQTLEYSLDNGSTWSPITSNLSASITRWSWIPPAGTNTSTALIRVSSGTLSDASDANFKILGIPTGLGTGISCDPGSLVFNWAAVANATNYDLLQLDLATGQFVPLSTNITGTTFTLTGLTPGASLWFTLVAKNSTTGAVSDRAIAINRVVPATGFNAIGAITGSANICGATTGLAYTVPTVPGAVSYTWTVPAGAVISSGQGSSSIIVSYPVGSVSGNVTTSASAGTCQTPVASLPVVVNSTPVVAPVSGGNQSQAHCSASPLPTLTATATVPANHSVIWYSAATGGTVVTSPTLNSLGTVTYYAASKNNTVNCESAGRTAVTLTIVSAPPATVTAAGSLTFCQGGSVVLTASPGNTYTWSNGATTQSITATSAGTYTVNVDQGSGCVSTSAATTVVVNPLPSVNITAGTSPTFCQGGSVTLTASAGNSYLWSNGATTPSITVSAAGSYSVTVNQGNACVNTSAATAVVVNPLPTASVSAGGSTSFCQGGSVVLTASPGASYLWSNGATTQAITATTSGNYSVTVTNASGCSTASSATTVTVSPVPAISLSASPYTKLFPGLTTTLTATASGSVSYGWFKNGVPVPGASGSTLPVTINDLGAYSVRVVNAGGCSSTSSIVNIADSASAELFIYPNPNRGQFSVAYYNATPAKNIISVYDNKGSRIMTKTYTNTTGYQLMPVDIRNHGKGNYRVTVRDASGNKIKTAAIVVF